MRRALALLGDALFLAVVFGLIGFAVYVAAHTSH